MMAWIWTLLLLYAFPFSSGFQISNNPPRIRLLLNYGASRSQRLGGGTNHLSTTTTTATEAATTRQRWNQDELKQFAAQQGVILSLSTLGPGFRGVARSKHNETQILGYVEGFVRPGKTILHLDKMEVFRKMVKAARADNPDEFKGGGSVFGVGLLVGYLCLLHGIEQGCSEAEFLAIDDEEYQHKRLVRYYKNAGFNVVKYVGDDWRDVPDRLIWGGCGTLLRQDIPHMLDKWTRILQRQQEKSQSR